MMKRFDANGKLHFPDKEQEESKNKADRVLPVNQCYCPHGHSLLSETAVFNDHQGILIKVETDAAKGMIALSPFFGDKAKITLGTFTRGDLLNICCPECDVPLPVYSQCSCGGNIIALFTEQNANFANCIGICNRVGCHSARIQYNNELLIQTIDERIGNYLFWQQENTGMAVNQGRISA